MPDNRFRVASMLGLIAVLLYTPRISDAQFRATISPSAVFPSVVRQDSDESLDARLLHSIYGIQSPVFTKTMVVADRIAYPVMYGAVPAYWIGTLFSGGAGEGDHAVRLAASWGLAVGSVLALKHIVRRLRPFEVQKGIAPRRQYVGARRFDRFSFPSGHAAITTAIVTSLSLSYPRWYVIGPGYLIATSVSLSRIWLGVHYPSDVASGFVIGFAAGSLVHWAGNRLFD